MTDKDMHLPVWVLILGVVLGAAGVVCLCSCAADPVLFLIAAAACLLTGAAAILCWRNQWVQMISDEEFVYSTMFGRQTTYHVSQIRDLKRGADSMTLILENGKVHIENCAVLSERFLRILHKPVPTDAF